MIRLLRFALFWRLVNAIIGGDLIWSVMYDYYFLLVALCVTVVKIVDMLSNMPSIFHHNRDIQSISGVDVIPYLVYN
jgi:hypothetical protein